MKRKHCAHRGMDTGGELGPNLMISVHCVQLYSHCGARCVSLSRNNTWDKSSTPSGLNLAVTELMLITPCDNVTFPMLRWNYCWGCLWQHDTPNAEMELLLRMPMTTWHTQCWDGIIVENVTWQCDATNAEMELLLRMPRDNVTQPMRDQNIVDSALWQCDTTNPEMELLLRMPHDNVTQLTPRWNYCWGHHGIMWHNKHWDGIIVENAMWRCDASNAEMELLLRKSCDTS